MKVTVEGASPICEMNLADMPVRHVGILTTSLGLSQAGDPVVRVTDEYYFPVQGNWTTRGCVVSGNFRYRDLLPGERIIIEVAK